MFGPEKLPWQWTWEGCPPRADPPGCETPWVWPLFLGLQPPSVRWRGHSLAHGQPSMTSAPVSTARTFPAPSRPVSSSESHGDRPRRTRGPVSKGERAPHWAVVPGRRRVVLQTRDPAWSSHLPGGHLRRGPGSGGWRGAGGTYPAAWAGCSRSQGSCSRSGWLFSTSCNGTCPGRLLRPPPPPAAHPSPRQLRTTPLGKAGHSGPPTLLLGLDGS